MLASLFASITLGFPQASLHFLRNPELLGFFFFSRLIFMVSIRLFSFVRGSRVLRTEDNQTSKPLRGTPYFLCIRMVIGVFFQKKKKKNFVLKSKTNGFSNDFSPSLFRFEKIRRTSFFFPFSLSLFLFFIWFPSGLISNVGREMPYFCFALFRGSPMFWFSKGLFGRRVFETCSCF